MQHDIRDALARAAQLREEGRRGRQESAALRTLSRKELARSRTLTWQARDYRADLVYGRLLARVRGDAPGSSMRMRGLETRLAELLDDREAFLDAFQRYLEIERSLRGT